MCVKVSFFRLFIATHSITAISSEFVNLYFLQWLCVHVVCFSLSSHRFHLTGGAAMDEKSSAGVSASDVAALSDVGSSPGSPGGRGGVSTGR